MAHEPTVPQKLWVLPLQSMRIDVVDGKNAGISRLAETETFTVGSADGNDLIIDDPTVSRYHLELSRHASGGVAVLDHGSTNGTLAGQVRIERAVVAANTTLQIGATAIRISDADKVALELHDGDALNGLRGQTAVMRRLMAQIKQLAHAGAPVMLIGESGTGKELVARALHDLGPRKDGPFVTVDCGSLSPHLVASELFGHERGAFTGADREHAGAFERAHGGTVFLDELGELPIHLQPTLLGVLERRRFRRIGGRADIPVDVQVISATHRDLRAEVNAGTFRLDLYYRVAVALLRIPALRERVEDIPLLVEHFARECGDVGPLERLFPTSALEALSSHHWPGNVRELKNVVEAAVATNEAPALDAAFSEPVAPANELGELFEPLLALAYKEARTTLLEAFEARYLERLLERCNGNVSKAAREARIDRSHLSDLLKRHHKRAH